MLPQGKNHQTKTHPECKESGISVPPLHEPGWGFGPLHLASLLTAPSPSSQSAVAADTCPFIKAIVLLVSPRSRAGRKSQPEELPHPPAFQQLELLAAMPRQKSCPPMPSRHAQSFSFRLSLHTQTYLQPPCGWSGILPSDHYSPELEGEEDTGANPLLKGRRGVLGWSQQKERET